MVGLTSEDRGALATWSMFPKPIDGRWRDGSTVRDVLILGASGRYSSLILLVIVDNRFKTILPADVEPRFLGW